MFEKNGATQRAERNAAKLIDKLDRDPQPMNLPYEVVQASGRRREAKTPVRVRALVPMQIAYTEMRAIDGEVIAWTDKAVLVRYAPGQGAQARTVWVWANAVTRV